MNRSLLDCWLYDRVMLQPLGSAGTIGMKVARYSITMMKKLVYIHPQAIDLELPLFGHSAVI